MSDDSDRVIPRRRPPFPPPAGAPYGVVRRNAFGRTPIQPGLLPMNLMRSHLYPGQGDEVAEGLREFDQALARGELPPQLPQRLSFQWNTPKNGDSTVTDPGGGPSKPTASAASLAAAVAWAGGVGKLRHEVTFVPTHPADIEEAEAIRASLQLLSDAKPMLEPGVSRGANKLGLDDAMPTDEEMLAAYDQAQGIVRGQAVDRRATFITRAMRELAYQGKKVLSPLMRPQNPMDDGDDQ